MGNKNVKPKEVVVKEDHPPISVNSGEIKGISAGVVNVHCINQDIKAGGSDNVVQQQALDLRRDIQSMLFSRYMNMTLPRSPWLKDLVLPMEKYYVSLLLHQIPDLPGHEPLSKYINLEELFQPLGKENPSRILIEGSPGYGKTTLVLKIAFDWVKRASYLMGFDLVFILFLRHFESSLEDMIIDAATTEESDPQKTLEAIKIDTSRVLLLLDGYDEMKEEMQPLILPLLQRKKFPHMTVLVTSRTGKLTVIENCHQENSLFSSEVSSLTTDFWNKKVLIKGISPAQQDMFLKTYLSPEYNFDVISSRFNSAIGTRPKELMSCPLFLLLLAMLVVDSDLKYPQNKTQLYSAVFNFLIRKWLNRQNQKDEEINILKFSSEDIPTYVQHLDQFGRFALKMLHQDKMCFTEDEVLSFCDGITLSMGFLTKTTTVQRKRTTFFYEPLHKTLMEFLAAYHIWFQYKQNDRDYFEQEIRSIKEFSVQEMTSSLLLPFLAGLLNDKAEDLFKILLSDAFQYSGHFYSIIGILRECYMTDRLVQLIRPLIPPKWVISWFSNDEGFSLSPSHFTILRYGMLSHKIKTIQWNLQCKTNLPPKHNVDRLVLLIKFPVVVDLLSCKEVKCQELLFDFDKASVDYRAAATTTLITNGCVINATRVSFDVKSSTSTYLPEIYQAMTGDCKTIAIHRLSCVLNGKDNQLLPLLIEMMEINKIESLDLTLSAKKDGFPANKLFPFTQKMITNITNFVASKSTEVKYLLLFNTQKLILDINLNQLCHEGKKVWRRLWLTKVDIHVDKKIGSPLIIEDLKLFDINNIPSAIETLTICQCRALTCSLGFLLQFCHEVSEQWMGFESVVELTLVLRGCKIKDFSLQPIENFKNLQAISIQITKFNPVNIFVREFLWLLQALDNFRVLEVVEAEENLEFLLCFIDELVQMAESLPSDDSRTEVLLDTLKIQIELSENTLEVIRFNFFSLLTNIKWLLNDRHLQQLCIVVPRNPNARLEVASLVGSIFPREDDFLVSHDINGMNHDDTYNSKTYFDYNILLERYSITKR